MRAVFKLSGQSIVEDPVHTQLINCTCTYKGNGESKITYEYGEPVMLLQPNDIAKWIQAGVVYFSNVISTYAK